MATLITGAGLIGSHTARQLVDMGREVVLFDLAPNRAYVEQVVGRLPALVAADMRDLPALLQTVKQHHVDTIVHTAGLIGGRVSENSYTGATNNILGTLHVLEAARLEGLKRVVYVSTFGVYDRSSIAGSAIAESAPKGGRNLYSATKLSSELLVGAYAEQYGLNTVVIRPAGVFGRGHYVGGSSVGQAMRDLCLQIARGGPVVVESHRLGTNEYVYAKDVALATQLACDAERPAQRVYNAGSGVVTDTAALAEAVRAVAPGQPVEVRGDPAAGRHSSVPLDLGRAEAELGYRPRFTLEAALRDYAAELRSEAG